MQKTAPVLVHVAGWLVFFTLTLSFIGRSGDLMNTIFSFPFALFCIFYLLIFYGNIFLLDNFYSRKTMGWYVLIIAACFLFTFMLEPFDHLIQRMMPHPPGPPPGFPPPGFPPGPPPGFERHGPPVDIVSLVLFVSTWSLSTVSTVLKDFRLSREKAASRTAEKTKAELSFLKTQVNPHFLFNTLNNIYSLTLSKDDKAPDTVRKLSDIMRYVTEEAGNDYVPLASEIDCARDYIGLQRLRLNEKTTVVFNVDGSSDDKLVAPLIFMTFIENAFKYGVSGHEASSIDISIHAADEEIRFFCRNKVFPKKLERQALGMGIENAKKRLEQLYPGSHKLKIVEAEGFYTVELRLFNI